jgi:hypothetical protein
MSRCANGKNITQSRSKMISGGMRESEQSHYGYKWMLTFFEFPDPAEGFVRSH